MEINGTEFLKPSKLKIVLKTGQMETVKILIQYWFLVIKNPEKNG